jgi:poly-gamma-glutamate synthesis protein (capsule biosynthesis protein)
LAARKIDRFDVFRVPHELADTDLALGGDVMLGRSVGAEIERGADPLAGIRERLARASNRIVNLECVVSDKGAPVIGKRYCLRAPLEAIPVLTSARINAVSLANNHATDFGTEALLDAMARLRANDISVVGPDERIILQTRAGAKAAVIALDDTNDQSPLDRARVAVQLTEARKQASFVLVFMHWGEENTSRVTDRQHELARWLIDHGADAIAGAHPHCVQPFDSYHGRPIFYSLGNLVFDGAPNLPSWNRGNLLEVDLSSTRPAFQLVPVQLDGRGFPQLVAPDEKTFATAGAAFSRNRVQGASKNR